MSASPPHTPRNPAFAPVWTLASLCLLGAVAPLLAQPARDPSPHAVGFLRSGDARLHYLTWGTTGPTVILLPGYSLTAHAFDDIGERLASRARVVALTPRGFGESDAPDSSAYTITTLVADLRVLMDSLRIVRATLVGHSLSGAVVAAFALRYPGRVTQLVLLDAHPYLQSVGGDSIMEHDPVQPPPFQGDTTHDAVIAYLKRYRYVQWRPALEADARAKPLGAEPDRRRRLTEGYIADQWKAPPDLRALTVPALQVCAMPSASSEYPWLTRADTAYPAAARYVTRELRPFQRRLCAHFAATVPRGRTRVVEGSHYLFFTEPALTARIVRSVLR